MVNLLYIFVYSIQPLFIAVFDEVLYRIGSALVMIQKLQHESVRVFLHPDFVQKYSENPVDIVNPVS